MNSPVAAAALLACLPALHACSGPPPAARLEPIVGAWLVKDRAAPFPYHMYVFNADGTMQQANPDAGDAHASDSDGKGVWSGAGGHIRGKWLEVTADRATHAFTGRVEVSFQITVQGNAFSGTESARSWDASGSPRGGPSPPSRLEGTRITYP